MFRGLLRLQCIFNSVTTNSMAAFQNVSIQSVYAVLLLYINYVGMQNYQTMYLITINPMPDCFLTALKIHIDDVIK